MFQEKFFRVVGNCCYVHDCFFSSHCCCSINCWNAWSNVSSATLKAGSPAIAGGSTRSWSRIPCKNDRASSISYKATWQGSGRQRCENSGSFMLFLAFQEVPEDI